MGLSCTIFKTWRDAGLKLRMFLNLRLYNAPAQLHFSHAVKLSNFVCVFLLHVSFGIRIKIFAIRSIIKTH